jgi:hypothetical protein
VKISYRISSSSSSRYCSARHGGGREDADDDDDDDMTNDGTIAQGSGRYGCDKTGDEGKLIWRDGE